MFNNTLIKLDLRKFYIFLNMSDREMIKVYLLLKWYLCLYLNKKFKYL